MNPTLRPCLFLLLTLATNPLGSALGADPAEEQNAERKNERPSLELHGLNANSIEERIAGIRSRYNLIESAKLRSRIVEFESQDGAVSGACTTYFQGEEIVKAHLSHGGDHWASDEYFYYADGELFFAFAVDGSWRFTGKTLSSGEGETVDRTEEHRLYFSAGQVIRHLLKEASSTDPEKLPELLAKAANRPSDDRERAAQLAKRGRLARSVKSGADLGAIFESED